MKIWLDDIRDPKHFDASGYVWAKTADEAIKLLETGAVTYASLDHDLSEEQMRAGARGEINTPVGEKSGYDVILWLEQNPSFWPVDGVQVHSMNPSGRRRMEQAIRKHYRQIWPFSLFTVRCIHATDVID
jgi:hypothetical protein